MTAGPEDSWMKIFTNTKIPHKGKNNKTKQLTKQIFRTEMRSVEQLSSYFVRNKQ